MVGCARIDFHRHAQRPPKSLENSFNLVVRILAADVVDVQRDHRVIHKALKKFMEQIDVKVAYGTLDELHVVIEARTTGKIQHHPGERLIKRNIRVAVAPDAGLVERLIQRLTQRDANVLNRVMGIDVQIASRPDRQVNQPVARNLIEHVIKKRQTGLNVQLT